jgi:hypothetical protein
VFCLSHYTAWSNATSGKKIIGWHKIVIATLHSHAKSERDNGRRMVMLRDAVEESGVEVDPAVMWAPEHQAAAEPRWRTVDRALRAIKQRRAALDAEEAQWLREAEALQIWRPLGMVSALDYLERVLGYALRSAQDRLRVARALGDLPAPT